MHKQLVVLLLVTSALVLSGCAGPDNSKGRFKVGSPYSIKGKTYYPSENYTKEQEGMASWYGPGFHGKKTANGERFDQMALTAAHPTLQMPSLVRVTNINNGRSVVVRVNDRGPFHSDRIIDLSKGAAEALQFRNMGTTKVRVQVLGPESMALAQAAKQGVDTRGAEIAMNNMGTLDDRFAAYYPNYVTVPQADVMVAASTFQPQAPAIASLQTESLAVPTETVGGVQVYQQVLITSAPPQMVPTSAQVLAVEAAPLQPQAPVQAPIKSAMADDVQVVRQQMAQPRVFQMAPVVSGDPSYR